jgi:hypothetical protein
MAAVSSCSGGCGKHDVGPGVGLADPASNRDRHHWRRSRLVLAAHPVTIVTSVYRPKRQPRKKAQAAAITGPRIVVAKRSKRIATPVDDGQETSPEIKAFFDRMMRPRGE